MLRIMSEVTEAVSFLHTMNFTHRDIHPSRIHVYTGNQIKLNVIGLPYNFKKLIKRDNFTGHINYSAPELIYEQKVFSSKVDIWSLGCCFFYLLTKKILLITKIPLRLSLTLLTEG